MGNMTSYTSTPGGSGGSRANQSGQLVDQHLSHEDKLYQEEKIFGEEAKSAKPGSKSLGNNLRVSEKFYKKNKHSNELNEVNLSEPYADLSKGTLSAADLAGQGEDVLPPDEDLINKMKRPIVTENVPIRTLQEAVDQEGAGDGQDESELTNSGVAPAEADPVDPAEADTDPMTSSSESSPLARESGSTPSATTVSQPTSMASTTAMESTIAPASTTATESTIAPASSTAVTAPVATDCTASGTAPEATASDCSRKRTISQAKGRQKKLKYDFLIMDG